MWLIPCKPSCVMNQLQFILHSLLLKILSPGYLRNLSTLFWHLNYFGSLKGRNSLRVKANFFYCAFVREVMAWPQWLCFKKDSVLFLAMQWNAAGEKEDTIWGQGASKGTCPGSLWVAAEERYSAHHQLKQTLGTYAALFNLQGISPTPVGQRKIFASALVRSQHKPAT